MPLRILIADDSFIVREAIKALLSSTPADWTVCGEAADGHETLRQVGETLPDVLLLDVSIPLLSGTEVVRALQQRSDNPKIILMSQQDERVLKHIADSIGVSFFLSKSKLANDLPTVLRTLDPRR